MSTIVMASVPIYGHVAPMIGLAGQLIERGHRVRFVTGGRFAPQVAAIGAEFIALPADADFDDRLLNAGLDKSVRPDGIAGLRYDVTNTFLRPGRAQYDALASTMSEPLAAVVVDPTFVGAALLAAAPKATRPPVIVAGVLPLTLDSDYVPPFGLGLSPLRSGAGGLDRARNRVLRLLVQRGVFGPVQREYDVLFSSVVGRRAPSFVMNWVSGADAIIQFSVPAFEYPRPDATVPIRFAGPMIRSTAHELPSWWRGLDSSRPLVLVTQGTIANHDLDELIRPTVSALAGSEVQLVVTTGGPPVSQLGALPSNVRAAEFLPYDQLFPRVDAFVTNGGYGGVHFALANGVPSVVAGAGEDKPEVAARVAWSGVGVNLRTGRPRPADIAQAVRRVLDEPAYRRAAGAAARQISEADGVDALLDEIERLRSHPAGTAQRHRRSQGSQARTQFEHQGRS
ncbi:MAG: glycosyltransferase [Micropruina sp.]|uniref:glycosyltransferase n=1 Tax=Micropruina sp. TaxID=2737536 RepID=UPI0039E35BA5